MSKLTDREMIVFLMDEIDNAMNLLVNGQSHMATGVLGRCHSEIRKHLSRDKELEEYQKKASELWNDSCTTTRASK